MPPPFTLFFMVVPGRRGSFVLRSCLAVVWCWFRIGVVRFPGGNVPRLVVSLTPSVATLLTRYMLRWYTCLSRTKASPSASQQKRLRHPQESDTRKTRKCLTKRGRTISVATESGVRMEAWTLTIEYLVCVTERPESACGQGVPIAAPASLPKRNRLVPGIA